MPGCVEEVAVTGQCRIAPRRVFPVVLPMAPLQRPALRQDMPSLPRAEADVKGKMSERVQEKEKSGRDARSLVQMQTTCWGISLLSLSRWRERVGVRVGEFAHIPLTLAFSPKGRGDCLFPKRFPENALNQTAGDWYTA